MSVLVYTESSKGKLKKSSLEAVSYASKVAAQLGTTATAVIIGDADVADLGKAGAKKVLKLKNDQLAGLDGALVAKAVEQAVAAEGSDVIIFAHDFSGKAIAPRVAAKLKAGIVAGATELPTTSGTFSVRKNVFSGKASAVYTYNSAKKIISLLPGAFAIDLSGAAAEVADLAVNLDGVTSPIKVKEVKQMSSGINMLDTYIVVSG